MAIKIGLSNGETIIYSTEETFDQFKAKLKGIIGENGSIEIMDRKLNAEDINYFTEVSVEDGIEATLATIQKKSHELSFERGKDVKGSYMVPVYVSVEFDEENGVVIDIRLDGMKEYLMKHI